METVLSWIGVAIGVAGAALGTLAGGRVGEDGDEGPPVLPSALASLVLVVAAFLLTLPSNPPFSLGGRLGWGILVGGVLGVAAGWIARVRRGGGFSNIVAPSLALLGAGVLLLIFHDYPQAAFSGFLVGAAIPMVVFGLTSRDAVQLWAISAFAVGTTVLLATLRYNTVDTRVWWCAPLLILGSAIIAAVLGTIISRGRAWLAGLVASAVVAGLVAVFAWKLFPDWSLLSVSVIGILTYGLIAWLGSVESDKAPVPAVITLAVIALAALSYRTMAGFGIGISTVAALGVLLVLMTRRDGEQRRVGLISYAMLVGVGLVLVRLFMEGFAADLRGMDLRAHYTIVAIIIGAIFPLFVPSLFPLSDFRAPVRRVVGACAAGAFAAATPLLLMVVWGPKALLGFLIGTIAAKVFLLFAQAGAVEVKETQQSNFVVLSTVAQLSSVIFAGLVLPLYEEPRATKIIMLGAALVLIFAWAAVSYVFARRTAQEA